MKNKHNKFFMMLKRNLSKLRTGWPYRWFWKLFERFNFPKSPRVQSVVLNIEWVQFVLKKCEILYSVWGLYDKTAPHSTLSPQMWCIKNIRLVCTHPDLLARICKLVDRKKFGLICFSRLIYCEQEPLLLLNLTGHLFGCTYKAISTRYKIRFQNHLTFQWELRF